MFQRVCVVQRRILSAARCRAAANPLHQSSSTTTAEEEEDARPHSHTSDLTEPHARIYDPATFRLPFDTAQGKVIMDLLNAATPQHLTTLGVGKGMAGRLLRHRERVGGYQELSQLLEVDGLGMRNAEGVCRTLLQGCGSAGVAVEGVEGVQRVTSPLPQSEVPLDTQDLVMLVSQKRLVKPRISDKVLKNMEYFVALHVTAGFLSWVLCGADGQIHSFATHPLLSANIRFDTLKIYDKVLSVTRQIPTADFYVWEDRTSHSHLAKAPLGTVIVALQLAQIRGMLMALLGGSLQEGEEEEEERQSRKQGRLLFLKDTVVPKLFRLKMGGDRQSGLGVADRIMDGQRAVDWLPLVTLEEEVHEAYFCEAAEQRRYTAAAVLVAVAFREVVLSKNIDALRVLSQ